MMSSETALPQAVLEVIESEVNSFVRHLNDVELIAFGVWCAKRALEGRAQAPAPDYLRVEAERRAIVAFIREQGARVHGGDGQPVTLRAARAHFFDSLAQSIEFESHIGKAAAALPAPPSTGAATPQETTSPRPKRAEIVTRAVAPDNGRAAHLEGCTHCGPSGAFGR
jgi:hypothetical protein